jgi:hypothetical protein
LTIICFQLKIFYAHGPRRVTARTGKKILNQEATPMAVAKKPAPKKAVKAPAKPLKTVKVVKPAKKAATRKGAKYGCKDCGLVVSIVDDCGCATMDLLCCGTPMKKKRPPVKK